MMKLSGTKKDTLSIGRNCVEERSSNMRKGLDKVIKAWHAGKRAAMNNLQTDGTVVYHYNEPIAFELRMGELSTFYVLEAGEFSKTTSINSNACADASPANHVVRVTSAKLKQLLAERGL
jgi:hypothetical protein